MSYIFDVKKREDRERPGGEGGEREAEEEKEKMRIVFMGTLEFAVPSLEGLVGVCLFDLSDSAGDLTCGDVCGRFVDAREEDSSSG